MSKMSKKTNKKKKMDENQKDQIVEKDEQVDVKEVNKEGETVSDKAVDNEAEDQFVQELDKIKNELEDARDKYLRLYSEFENYRRRTAKERLDLIGSATEDLMASLLPVIDDFERAEKAFDEKSDIKAVKEGYDLIFNKLKSITDQKGLKVMDLNPGDDFDPEFQEAVTHIPAPEEKFKGKIVDVLEKGYLLNEKVIRFAKVVTGS